MTQGFSVTPETAQLILDAALQDGSLPQGFLKVLAVGVARSGKTSSKKHIFGIECDPNFSASTGVCEGPIHGIRSFCSELIDLNALSLLTTKALIEVLGRKLRQGFLHGSVAEAAENILKGASITLSSPNTSAGTSGGGVATPSGDSAASKAVVTAFCDASKARVEARSMSRQPFRELSEEQLFKLQVVLFLDSGGQPQFHAFLPAVAHNVCLVLLFMKLNERLDALCCTAFTDEKGKWYMEQCSSLLTNEQMLVQLVHTMMCKPLAQSKGKHTMFMVIGTHRDLMHECDETLEEKNERLAFLLLPALEDVLITNGNKIIFAVNAKSPDKIDEKCFGLIRGHICNLSWTLEVVTPISFLMFQIDLIKYGKEHKKRVVSMEECRAIGGRLKMGRKSLEAALIHFNKLSMFLYLPSVLPGRVFIDPQMPLDSVTRIVAHSYKVGCGEITGLSPSDLQLWKEGVVTQEVLKGDMFSSCFVSGLFEVEDALKFFHSIYITASLSESEFIMPAMLPTVSMGDIQQYLPAPSDHVAPLFLHFHKSRIATGIFCSTHTCMRSKFGWKTCYTIKRGKRVPACLFRNAVKLQHPSKPIKITFVHAVKHFEVYVDSPQADLPTACPHICDMLLNAVDTGTTAFHFTNSRANIAFQCPCSPDDVHTAILNEAHSNLMCTITGEITRGGLTAAQKVWLRTDPLTLSQTMSDKRVQEIIGKAQKSGSLKVRKIESILTGLTGSGKTWLLSSLFHTLPPELYNSTCIAFHQGLLLPNYNLSLGPWKLLSHTDVFECLNPLFLAGMTEANISLSESLISPPFPSPFSTVHSELQPFPANPTSDSKKEISLELLHMIDVGGEPELMEIMPSIVHDPNLAVVVLNMMYGLDEHPSISLHIKGVGYKRKMPSRYTARQILKKIVATLIAKRSSRKKKKNLFHILVVATHRDCVVGDLEARVKTLNHELRTLLLPSCKDELICYSPDLIPFVLKLKNPDDRDEETLQLIRSKVSTSSLRKDIEMPRSFFMYKQDLLKNSAKGILSLDECLLVGERLNMSNEEVIAALDFLHNCHTFLYFRKVLPNLIFVNPEVPLNFINALVFYTCSYKVSSDMFHLKHGIITEEILRNDEFSTFFVPGLFEPHHAIKLLCNIFALAPLDHEQKHTKEKKYLMMSLLPAIPDEELHYHVPSSPEMTPLIIKFTRDCVPLGVFGSTISNLLSTYEWIVKRNENNSPECLAQNIALLIYPPNSLSVVLVDSSDYIKVYVGAHKELSKMLPEFRKTILGAIRDVLGIMHLTEINVLPAVLCPCNKVSVSHPASLIEVQSEKLLYCPKTKLTQGKARDEHVKWFGDNPLENSSPEYILQDALREGSIPHRDDKFLIHGPGGVGKSSLVAIFLGDKRSLSRNSTALAAEPLHLTPIRDISTSRYNSKWERVNYERLSHMIAHACYKRYLKGSIKIKRGWNSGEHIEVGIRKNTDEEKVDDIVKSATEHSQLATSAGDSKPEKARQTWQQAELHEPQQNEPELSHEEELEDECLTTTLEDDEIQRVIDDFLWGLQEKIRDTEESTEDLLSHSIRILDSGGQPQFHELIAIFLSYISGFVSVFKLNEYLSEHGEVVLYEDGKPINDPYRSHYSNEQVIRHDLQAIQAKAVQRGMEEMPTIAFVGTFLDKAEECNETPAMKDERLYRIITEMLPKEMRKCVITCGNTLQQTTFQINARIPEDQDFDTVDKLKEALLKHSQVQPRELPLKWHGLEVALHVLMEKLNRQALRRDECEVVAYNLSFDLPSLNEALEYMHQLNIIACYDVLPNVIFGSSQVVLNMITKLVRYSLVLKGKIGLNGKERDFIHRGIVSLEFLRSSALKKLYIPKLFQADDLLKVLISQLVISKVDNEEFIMPCVLEVKNTNLPPSISDCCKRSSFILQFLKKSPMFGIYCCTVSSLISDADWKLVTKGGKVQVARNSFTFKVPPGKLFFRDPLSSYFEVIFDLPNTVAAEDYVTLYHEIRNEILKAITRAMQTLKYDVLLPEVSFLCPKQNSECSLDPHPATVDRFQKYLTCSLNPDVSYCLTDKQKIWLQKSTASSFSCPSNTQVTVEATKSTGTTSYRRVPQSSSVSKQITETGEGHTAQPPPPPLPGEPPSLPELLRLKVPQEVGTNYFTFGTFLLSDQTGSRVNAIDDECRGKSDRIIFRMLQEWLEGKGLPVTWESLVQILRDTGLSVLADQIEALKIAP